MQPRKETSATSSRHRLAVPAPDTGWHCQLQTPAGTASALSGIGRGALMSGMPEMEFGHQKEASGSKVCEKETSGTFNTCCGKWTCFLMGAGCGLWWRILHVNCHCSKVTVTLSLGVSECSFWVRSVFGSLDSTTPVWINSIQLQWGLNGTRVEEGGSSFSRDVWDLVSSCSCVESQQLFWVSGGQTTDYGHNQESPSFVINFFMHIHIHSRTHTHTPHVCVCTNVPISCWFCFSV